MWHSSVIVSLQQCESDHSL